MPRYAQRGLRDPTSVRGSLGQRRARPRSRSVARSTALTNPAALGLSCISRQVDGVVDDGGGRHAIEMQELVEAEAQDVKNLAVDRGERAPREMFDEDVEAALPAQRPGDDLRGECAVAFVGQLPTTRRERRGKVDRPSATARSA